MRELFLFLSGSITAILVPAVTELIRDWVRTRRAETNDARDRYRANVTALLDLTQEIYSRVLKEVALPTGQRDLSAIISEYLPRFSRLEAMIDDSDLHATMYEVRECLVGMLLLDTNDAALKERMAHQAHSEVMAAQRQMHQILSNTPKRSSRTFVAFLASRLSSVLTIAALLALAVIAAAVALFDGITFGNALFVGVAVTFGVVLGMVITVGISRLQQRRDAADAEVEGEAGGETATNAAD